MPRTSALYAPINPFKRGQAELLAALQPSSLATSAICMDPHLWKVSTRWWKFSKNSLIWRSCWHQQQPSHVTNPYLANIVTNDWQSNPVEGFFALQFDSVYVDEHYSSNNPIEAMHSALMECNATHSIVMCQCDAFTLTLLYLVCISAEGRLIANYQIASNIAQQQILGCIWG